MKQPTTLKTLQSFLTEVIIENGYDDLLQFKSDYEMSTHLRNSLINESKDRFHAYQLNQLHGQNEALVLQVYDLKEQLESKDKEIEKLNRKVWDLKMNQGN